jgi:hypothetical protein
MPASRQLLVSSGPRFRVDHRTRKLVEIITGVNRSVEGLEDLSRQQDTFLRQTDIL